VTTETTAPEAILPAPAGRTRRTAAGILTGVLTGATALLTVAVLIMWGTLGSQRAQTASQRTRLDSQGTRIARLEAELHRAETLLSSQGSRLATLRQPATAGHLGVCFQETFDPSTFDVSGVTVSAPVVTSGVPSCPAGSFVSIVPGG